MVAVSALSFAPLLGCGLMMVLCMGPMFSQRVRGWFSSVRSDEQAPAAPLDPARDEQIAALRREVAELGRHAHDPRP